VSSPFRRAFIGLHLFITSVFCLLVAVSVIRSVTASTLRQTPVAQTQSAGDCQKQAQRLWENLEEERKGFVLPKLKTANSWMEYHAHWMTQLEALQKSCADSESQKRFQTLRRLMEIYSSHMTAFAQELAPAIRALHRDIP